MGKEVSRDIIQGIKRRGEKDTDRRTSKGEPASGGG